MTTIVIVGKLGNVSEYKVKKINIEELYKKCGYRKNEGFNKVGNWKVKMDNEVFNLELYGKIEGKAGQENKYDFPPPVDNVLFFGNMAIINKDNENNIVDLTMVEWEKIYEKLFGGFENLDELAEEDENEEDELKNIPEKYKTKSGYLKDGFVVDEEDDEDDEEEEEEEEESDSENSELTPEEYEYSSS